MSAIETLPHRRARRPRRALRGLRRAARAVAYNSCRNRHCPKCQAAAARRWLADREAELLPVPTFTSSSPCRRDRRASRSRTRRVVYDLLFRAAAETLTTIAADPKHLGARIGLTAVLHTWGSALTHHPHVHVIVPGGGLSPDGSRWIACKPGFFLPVRVLSRLFRRLFLDGSQPCTTPAASSSSATSRRSPTRPPSTPPRAAAPLRVGGLRQAAVRRTAGRCSPISPATPTASRSRTAGSSRSTTRASPSRWKDYRIEGRTGSRP